MAKYIGRVLTEHEQTPAFYNQAQLYMPIISESKGHDHSWLDNELEASQKPCLKKRKKERERQREDGRKEKKKS